MPFTYVNSFASQQSLALAREIVVAYNKRRLVCGLSTYDGLAAGSDCFDFFSVLQAGIEGMVTYFSNKNLTLTGQTSLPVNYSTTAAGMTGIGLSQTGYWRRIPNGSTNSLNWRSYGDTSFSYGRIQNGDEYGPWLWLDLQNALSGLTRIVKSCSADQAYFEQYDRSEPTVWDSLPSWEGVGSPDETIKTPLGRPGIYINKGRNMSYIGGNVDQINANVNNILYTGPYTPPTGTASCASKIIALVNNSSNYVFPSLTGFSSSDIGKMVSYVATKTDTTAYAWTLFSPTRWVWSWADISTLVPWSEVTEEDNMVGKSFSIGDQCLVHDYNFSDGSTT